MNIGFIEGKTQVTANYFHGTYLFLFIHKTWEKSRKHVRYNPIEVKGNICIDARKSLKNKIIGLVMV